VFKEGRKEGKSPEREEERVWKPRAKAEPIILRRHASSLICIINGNAALPQGRKKGCQVAM